jgi:hypothetical protein
LKISRQKDDYGKVKVVSMLFGAFVLLLGVSSIFADAIFEFLGLEKPQAFEILSLISFSILCLFSFLIMDIKVIQQKRATSKERESIFDYSNSYQDASHTQNNLYNSTASEKVFEYLGLMTLLKRFDIDINIDKQHPNSDQLSNSEIDLSEHLLEDTFILPTEGSQITEFPKGEDLEIGEMPDISIEHDKGIFDIDIDDILPGGN